MFPEKEDGWPAEAAYGPREDWDPYSFVDHHVPGGRYVHSVDPELVWEWNTVTWSWLHQVVIGDVDETVFYHRASVFPSGTKIVFESDS